MPRVKKQILDQEQKLNLAITALKFYADKQNWKPSDAYHTFATISDADLKYYPNQQTSDLSGGKLAFDTPWLNNKPKQPFKPYQSNKQWCTFYIATYVVKRSAYPHRYFDRNFI